MQARFSEEKIRSGNREKQRGDEPRGVGAPGLLVSFIRQTHFGLEMREPSSISAPKLLQKLVQI